MQRHKGTKQRREIQRDIGTEAQSKTRDIVTQAQKDKAEKRDTEGHRHRGTKQKLLFFSLPFVPLSLKLSASDDSGCLLPVPEC
jgi:hypothetical protein